MKQTIITLLLLIATTAFADVVKRGAAVSDAKATPLADVLASPDAYKGKTLVVEGVVNANCTEMGCWMEIAPAAEAKQSMHITFKDYGFFIPKSSKGMKARAEGVVSVETLSKDEADHLAGEGAVLHRNADGTATQVAFVANGVELTK
jgi:hypothetical protein